MLQSGIGQVGIALRIAGDGESTSWSAPAQDDGAAAHLNPAGAPRILIGTLSSADIPEIERHLLDLDPAGRRARFSVPVSDAVIVAYARGIDPACAVLFGAVDGPSGRIVGLAEAQPTGAPHRMEVAVSVQASHRRRGLGRLLVSRALATAFARGAEVAEFSFAPDNRPVAGMVRALGARFAATLDRAELRRG